MKGTLNKEIVSLLRTGGGWMDGQLVKDLIPCFVAFNSPPVLIQFNSLVTRLLCRLLLPEPGNKEPSIGKERNGKRIEFTFPNNLRALIWCQRASGIFRIHPPPPSLYQTTIHTKPCRLVNAACSYPARDFITKDDDRCTAVNPHKLGLKIYTPLWIIVATARLCAPFQAILVLLALLLLTATAAADEMAHISICHKIYTWLCCSRERLANTCHQPSNVQNR